MGKKSGIYIILLIIAVIMILALSNCGEIGNMLNPPTPTATNTATPSKTPTPSLTATPTLTPTPTPGIGSTQVSPMDGMVMNYVPAGPFGMGSTYEHADGDCREYTRKLSNYDCYQDWFSNELPFRTVELDAYWIDQTEVTNSMYALCVQAGACQPPGHTNSATRNSYYDDPEYKDFPVIYTSWFDAEDYCTWAGRRLPSEAEWEKAARGTTEQVYPWGDMPADETLLSFNIRDSDTNAVGKFPLAASPFGALDMAGNVWEWVVDWYQDDYYAQSPIANPQGPPSGDNRVIRGGSFHNNDGIVGKTSIVKRVDMCAYHDFKTCRRLKWQERYIKGTFTVYPGAEITARTAFRFWSNPSEGVSFIGFRCALSAPTNKVSETSGTAMPVITPTPTMLRGTHIISYGQVHSEYFEGKDNTRLYGFYGDKGDMVSIYINSAPEDAKYPDYLKYPWRLDIGKGFYPYIILRDGAGEALAKATSTGELSRYAEINYMLPNTGIYYIVVSSTVGAGTYDLHLELEQSP
jgi:formylglycine-generating enzyme required for sulfatase activity